MKLLVTLLTLVLAFNAKAGLITSQSDQNTYNSGDTVTVDFYVNNANPMIDWLAVEYIFDNSLLAFERFTITKDVFDNSYFDDGYVLPSEPDLLILNVGFNLDWDDFLTTSFKLGEVEFTALSDAASVNLQLSDIYAEDLNMIPISQDNLQVSVPEPASFAFIPLFAGLLLLKRRKQSQLK